MYIHTTRTHLTEDEKKTFLRLTSSTLVRLGRYAMNKKKQGRARVKAHALAYIMEVFLLETGWAGYGLIIKHKCERDIVVV